MSNLLDLLQGQLGSGLIGELSKQMGAPEEKTEAATNGILSTLIGALSKNASTPEGAASLNKALERDHDGSMLENIMGMVMGTQSETKAADGAGILGHILGSKQNTVTDALSKSTGLDSGTIMSMMMKLAPMVMGALGKAKSQNGLDQNGVADLLNGTVQENTSTNPLMAMAGKLLDQDGDGSYMDDLGGIGMNILGGLFKK